jgi:flavin-binding protein dodecin
MRKLLENRIINQGGNGMVVKVIELVGTSSHNWTDAVDNAVMEASRSIDDILGVEVTNFTANIDNGHIAEYKADVKVAFKVNH